jgi:hypothetical protein
MACRAVRRDYAMKTDIAPPSEREVLEARIYRLGLRAMGQNFAHPRENPVMRRSVRV